MARWKLWTIALPIVFGVLYATFFIVNERDQVAVLRFGEVVHVRSEPGIYFKLPFFFLGADRIQRFEDRKLRYDLPEIRLQVSSGKFYDVSAFVIYRIVDTGRLLEKVAGDLDTAHQRLNTRLDSALRKVYGLRGFEAALSIDRRPMMDEVRNELQPAAAQLGLVIDDVRIERTELTEQVRDPTFERMRAERFAAAELIRARGRESAQRLRAVADRQVIEILATAQRDAQISRGEGEGRRAEIFSKAHIRSPEFYSFYRSMDAYEKSLSDSATTLILSPESHFFRYFTSPDKR